ncbi:MAG: hypothetical protein DRI61_10405, partial [Chloroflexi bacterium]
VVATFTDTTQPGSVAIAWRPFGLGKEVLFNGHPSDKIYYYPQVIDALLWAMGRRATIRGELCQTYRGNVPCNIIPAYEPDVPIRITTTFRNLWDVNLCGVRITETVQPGFVVSQSDVNPAPTEFYTALDGSTIIVWEPHLSFGGTPGTPGTPGVYTGCVAPGEWHGTYIARTLSQTMKAGSALVSRAEATYFDNWDVRYYKLRRNDLYVSAKMAARLVGDRDIELDAIYPLRDQGEYFDIALVLENKEETDAHQTRITDVVALISPIVDVDDQRRIPRVITDTWGISDTDSLSDTLWAVNEVFFYRTPVPVYPLPTYIDGVPSDAITVGVRYGLATWLSGPRLVYTFTGNFTTTPGLSNSITIPPGYEQFITVTADGDILLPALRLAWDYGDFPAYDYQEPAVRYGIFSHEALSRTVSFASDPISPSLVLDASGGSVFTNLGGHPIPYHEYLRSGIVSVPIPPEMSKVTWQDIWSRPHTMTLRTVFYDIVPFPPPEYHAVVNTTFEMLADRDGDGVGETRVLEFPAREGADINFYIKTWSNFYPGLNLGQDETLLSQGMFRGLGYKLEPKNGSWWDSWTSPNLQGIPTATQLITIVSTPAYDFLYFQQYLEAQKREAIYISATLSTYPHVHKEGVMKVDDGARFVYHQKAAGPSRYEVYDTHVQAVFGLSSDAQADKWVAPARIATYDDEVYHFIRIRDPYDPRDPCWGPYIKSYGFWDLAATTYVGGRHRDEVLFPRVRPGGKTQIRIEIRNNQNGITLTNLIITPTAPAGITVTLRPTVETRAIEPIFFDFPFLHLTRVPEGWRTVWYYDVEVSPGFTDTGKVHEVTFGVSADGLPDCFQIPPAEIRVEDASGRVKTVWGQATDLKLTDVLPPWAMPLAARLANDAEKEQLEQYLALGQTYTATNYFLSLRPVDFITVPVADGTLVSFTLPVSDTYDATQMPWLEDGERKGTLWVILKSRAQVDWSGTALINYAPVITYTDPFSQVYSDIGNEQTVESHGPWLVVTYTVGEISYGGEPDGGLWPGEQNLVSATLEVWNRGDYIAEDTVVTTVFTSETTLLWATQPPSAEGEDFASFAFGDLSPNDIRVVEMMLAITPTTPVTGTSVAQVGSEGWYVIDHTDGHFEFDFLQAQGSRRVVVDRRLAGALWLPQAHRVFSTYMPLIFKNYRWTWWPQSK